MLGGSGHRLPRARAAPPRRRLRARGDLHRSRPGPRGRRGGVMSDARRSVHPPNDSPEYRSTALRAPTRRPHPLPEPFPDLAAPLASGITIGPLDSDLTRQHDGEPLGERITISGRVLDEQGDPVAGALVEVWQANAAGRYAHVSDQHPAPLDPNFSGAGRCVTDELGRYRFVTIK